MGARSTDLRATFAQRFRAARRLAGMSQADVAARTGLQPSAISHLESGKRMPSLETLRAVADAVGASVDDLLDRNDGTDWSNAVRLAVDIGGAKTFAAFVDCDSLAAVLRARGWKVTPPPAKNRKAPAQ